MPRKTKLLKLSTDQISKLKKDELEKLLRTSIRYSYKKHRELDEFLYRNDIQYDTDYNETFRSVVGKTSYQALKKVPNMTYNQMSKMLAYIRRNLLNKKSTVEGVRELDRESIIILVHTLDPKIRLDTLKTKNIVTKDFEDAYEYQYIRNDRVEVNTITAKDLRDFWKIVRKADEDHTLTLYGSGDGIKYIYQELFVESSNKTASKFIDELKSKKEDKDLEEWKQEQARNQRRKQAKFKGTVK